jgi:heme exporter protein CcmB
MGIFWVILRQEILLSFRNLNRVLFAPLFFLVSISVFLLLSQGQDSLAFSHLISAIWFILLSCMIFSSAEFLKKDFEDGSLEQLLIYCENCEIFILAKMLGNWLCSILPSLMVILLFLLLGDFSSEVVSKFMILLFLSTLAINFICAFCGSLSILGNSAPIIAIIAYPLAIPTILVSCGGLLVGQNFADIVKTLLGITFFSGSLAVLATAKIAKISIE